MKEVDGQGVLPQGGHHRDAPFETGRQTGKQQEDHSGGAAHDEPPVLPAVPKLLIAVGPQHHLRRDPPPQHQPLQTPAAGGRQSQGASPGPPPRPAPGHPQAVRLSEVMTQQKPGLKHNEPGGAPLVVDALVKAGQQRQRYRRGHQQPPPPEGGRVVHRQQQGVDHQDEEIPQDPVGPGELHVDVWVPQLLHKGGIQPLEEQIRGRHAQQPLDPVKSGKHPAEEQKGGHIPIPDGLCTCLQEYMSHCYGLQNDDRLFPYTKSFLYHEMEYGCKASGVKRIRVHDIRHSHASLLVEMGFSPLLIAERLGHEKVQTTMDTYSHLYPNKQVEVARQLDGIMP